MTISVRMTAIIGSVLLGIGAAGTPIPSVGQFIELVRDGDLPSVRRAIEGGVDVNVKGKGGWTPLLWAAHEGHDAIARLLLEGGADPNLSEPHGQTPLHIAGHHDRLSIVEGLISHGGDIDARDEGGRTPLHLSIRGIGGGDVAKFLIERGVDVNAGTHDGDTPLHAAAESQAGSAPNLIRMLVDSGADATMRNKSGLRPLDIARKRGSAKVIAALESVTPTR